MKNIKYDLLLDLLKRKVRIQPLQLNLRELTRVIYQICAAITHQVDVQNTGAKLNTMF